MALPTDLALLDYNQYGSPILPSGKSGLNIQLLDFNQFGQPLVANEAAAATQTITLNQIASTTTVYNPTVSRQASLAISLNQIASTTTVFEPTVILFTPNLIILNQIESTSQVYQPTVSRQASKLITLDRIETTTQVFDPTVSRKTDQLIVLNLLGSASQVYLPNVIAQGGVTDTSDILSKRKKRNLTSKQEEEIAAQLLKARRKRPQVEQAHRKLINWKKLIYEAIYGAETVEQLEAIEIPTAPVDSPEVVAAILAEIEQQRAAKRAELELKQAELKLKMEEAALAASKLQSEIDGRLEQQRQAVDAIKALQQELIARHQIAVAAARQAETQAFLELQEAERKAQEFTQKRNNRIKRLKALMWLAKLDL